MNDDSFEELLQELIENLSDFIEDYGQDLPSDPNVLTTDLATPYDTIH